MHAPATRVPAHLCRPRQRSCAAEGAVLIWPAARGLCDAKPACSVLFAFTRLQSFKVCVFCSDHVSLQLLVLAARMQRRIQTAGQEGWLPWRRCAGASGHQRTPSWDGINQCVISTTLLYQGAQHVTSVPVLTGSMASSSALAGPIHLPSSDADCAHSRSACQCFLSIPCRACMNSDLLQLRDEEIQ